MQTATIHKDTQECRLTTQGTLTVPIHGQLYSPERFVEVVNDGYQQDGTFRHGKPHFERYSTVNRVDRKIYNKLAKQYDYQAASMFNGLEKWQGLFESFTLSEYAKDYPDNYFEDVLISDLQRHLKSIGISEKITPVDYKEYLEVAIDYDYLPHVDLKWSDDKGWSLFAAQDIFPFTFLGLYSADLISRNMLFLKEIWQRYQSKYKWAIGRGKQFILDAEKIGGAPRFVNHDIRKTDRIRTVSVNLTWPEQRCAVPHRGFIAYLPEPQQKQRLTTFSREQEILWYYGDTFELS